MTRVFIAPRNKNAEATGGIPRVVDAQCKWLGHYDIEIVDNLDSADVLCVHAATWIDPRPNQRVVSHCHGLYWTDYDWQSNWYYYVNKQVLDAIKLADVTTVPSEWVANSIRRATWTNPIVIGHGIDLEDWEVDEHGTKDYILWDKARQDIVCDPQAVNVLANSAPELKFKSTYGLPSGNVEIIGTIPYTEHKLNIQQALLYLATAPETFGISIIEAMACGVPIVGWKHGGQAELVVNGVHGYLAEPGDYETLVKGIRWCLSHRDELSRACRELVEDKYQWKQVIGQYAQLYHKLAEVERPTVKTSIIIPSYNLSKYLPNAIDSALMQGNDCEVIVVDDCSTDNSYDIAASYGDRIQLLKTSVNSNMPAVLNLGIQHAKGKYILNLDADNTLPIGSVKTLSGVLDGSPYLDIAYGRIQFVLEDGATPDRSISGDGISKWPPMPFDYSAQMHHKNQIPSSAMFRKKIWAQSGGYRRRCWRIGEDPDFWCRTTTLGAQAARVTDAVTLTYRMRETSRSHVQPEWPWEQWYTNKSPYRDGPIHLIDNPIISIIIPVGPGHGDQGISDALDSVYAQDMHQWEVIVIDDSGGEVRWLPSWVRSAKTLSPKSGVSTARNVGLELARGRYILFLDADDYLEHNALSQMLASIEKYGGYIYTDWQKADGETVRCNDFSFEDMLHNLQHPISCLFPLNSIKRLRFDESMRVGEDWDFILQVLTKTDLCGTHLVKSLLNYRLASGGNRTKLIENIDSIRELMKERYGAVGCGCGGGGGPTVIDYGTVEQIEQAAQTGELVLLEYTKADQAALTYTGPKTGQNYRFGSEVGHNKKYVHRDDAEVFLQRDEFRVAMTT